MRFDINTNLLRRFCGDAIARSVITENRGCFLELKANSVLEEGRIVVWLV